MYHTEWRDDYDHKKEIVHLKHSHVGYSSGSCYNVLASCLFAFFVWIFPHTEYRLGFHEELTETRYQAAELASGWLSETNANRKKETESALSQLAEKIK